MSVITYKCPNCDGGLVFDPESGKYVCEYCVSEFTQEELEKNAEEGTQTTEESAEQPTEDTAVIYHCPSCGAQIITDETTAASFCFYCHNPIVLSGRLSGEYLPDGIIPFKITKDEAAERFKSWIEKKKFVPRGFYSPRQIEKMSGVYFPYWLYDCEMDGTMSGEATDLRVWCVGDTEYTETKRYEIRRSGKMRFHNLPKTALNKAQNAMLKGIFPYDFTAFEKFHMGFLSGFQAEKRDIEKELLVKEMQRECEEYAQKRLRDTIDGHHSFVMKDHNSMRKEEHFQYALLPVWVLTYRSRGNQFSYFAMNGQTGEICGKLPLDYKKLGLLGVIVYLAVLVLFLIGGWLI